MKFRIKNIGKIHEADVLLDGITVLAGNNNTGKSTIGKALFGAFYSMRNFADKIVSTKKALLRSEINFAITRNRLGLDRSDLLDDAYDVAQVESAIEKIMSGSADIESAVQELFSIKGEEHTLDSEFTNAIHNLSHELSRITSVDDEELGLSIITGYFSNIFYDQINSLDNNGADGCVELLIKDRRVNLLFNSNRCYRVRQELDLSSSVYYIDNPYALDYMNRRPILRNKYLTVDTLVDGLKGRHETIEEETAVELLNKKRLDKILALLETVVPGEVNLQKKYVYKSERFRGGLDVGALSSGLKTFVILKTLLRNGSLRSKDVLILDEPEVHLHPDWLKLYAQLIVLLQQEYDLTILVTTHSFRLTEALDFYTRKHEISEKVHYYLCTLGEQQEAMIENVDGKKELIYRQWLNASDALRKEEYDWEESREMND